MADKNKIEIILTAIDTGVKAVFDRTNQAMGAADAGAGRYGRSMTALQAPLRAVTSALSGMIAAVGSGLLAKSLWDAGVAAKQLSLSFTAIATDATAGGQELAFVRAEANRLGQSFPVLAESYKGLFAASKGTALEGEGVRKVFIGITEASGALGLSADQAHGALYAVGQMMSKGKITAEELRQQLGERLPGAYNLMAEAAGVTAAQLDGMLQRGEVGIETLTRFSEILHEKYGPAAVLAAESALGAMGRLSTAWFDFKVAIANSGFLDQAAGYMRNLAAALNDPATQAAIKEWAKRFFELIDSVIRLAWEYKEFIAGFAVTTLAVSFLATLTTAVTGLSGAVTYLAGTSLGAWAASTVSALRVVAGGLLTVEAAAAPIIAVLAAIATGLLIGQYVGDLLNNFEFIRHAGADLIYSLDRIGLAAEKMWAMLTGGDVEAVDRKIAIAREAITQLHKDIDEGTDRPLVESKATIVPPITGKEEKKDTAAGPPPASAAKDYTYIDMLDESALSDADKADRKERWAKRDAEAKQVEGEAGTLTREATDKEAADREAYAAKQARIKELDAKRKTDPNSYYSGPGLQVEQAVKAAGSGLMGIDNLGGRVSAQLSGFLPGNDKPESAARQAVDKVHEIRLGTASLQGSPESVEDFLNQLQRAGLAA